MVIQSIWHTRSYHTRANLITTGWPKIHICIYVDMWIRDKSHKTGAGENYIARDRCENHPTAYLQRVVYNIICYLYKIYKIESPQVYARRIEPGSGDVIIMYSVRCWLGRLDRGFSVEINRKCF